MVTQKITQMTIHSCCISDMFYFGNFSNQGLSYHCHVDFYEFSFVVSGSYSHTYNGQKSTLKLGDFIFFRPGEAHELIENTADSNHYSIIVKDSYFREYCELHAKQTDTIFSATHILKKLSGSELAYLAHIASMIVKSASLDMLPVVDQFLSTALFICFESPTNATNNDIQIYAVDLLKRFDSYQILHFEIATIYNDYPISSTVLIRDFKKLTGYTIVEYRNLKRMEYAAQLLETENYSVTTIANILNISSLGYFSSLFKKQYGMTPKEYQLLHRRDKI